MSQFTNAFRLIFAALTICLAPTALAQTKIDKIAEVRFGNHGGSGYVAEVLEGPNDTTIVVGYADIPDPKRPGSSLTTLTYTEISADGTVLVDQSFGRAPALSVMDAVSGDGVTYIHGFNAPSLFSDNPDMWVAAIATGGKLTWRKPVDETKVGDIELFVDASNRLFMAGFVTKTDDVGILPWSKDGIMGKPIIFGKVGGTGWTYPDLLVRDSDSGGIELIYARSSDDEIRVDRFASDESENWTTKKLWTEQAVQVDDRPSSMALRNLSNGALVLTGQKGFPSLDKTSRRYGHKGMRYWIVSLETDGTPRLEHVDSKNDRYLVHIDSRTDNSFLVYSNAMDLKNVATKPVPSGLVGYQETIARREGQWEASDGTSYFGKFNGADTSDASAPVMFGEFINTEIGKNAGYAFVLANHVLFGSKKTFRSTFFGFFENIAHSRRLDDGNLAVVTRASPHSRLKGPVFRILRITPGVKE